MPRLKDVTDDELAAVIERAQDVSGDAADIARRLNSAGVSKLTKPTEAARSAIGVSRTLSELAAMLLMSAALQEQQREIEALMAERARQKE